jgi:hypothetical protein
MAGKIFINYRRDDSIGTAGRLHDRLAQTFGRKNLFMDVDHIPAGVDFVEYLHSQVAACDVFLAVIGPNWLDAKDDSGRRRFDNPDDFVTIEIAAALARKIRVIPVLVDGARTPKAEKLPDSVKPLVRRNAVEVRNTHFGRDAEALTSKVREALEGAQPVTGRWAFLASVTAWLRAPGHWRTVAASAAALLLVGWIGLYQVGVPLWVPWTSGTDAPRADKAAADAEAQRKAREAEQQRFKEEAQRQAQAAADADAKLKTAESERQRLIEEVQRQAKAAADAEAKLKAAEAEQQRLAATKEEEQRQARAAAEVEAKRKAAEAEQQRLAAAKAEEERKAKAEAEARTKFEQAEKERLAAAKAEEEERKAKAPAVSQAAPAAPRVISQAFESAGFVWLSRNQKELLLKAIATIGIGVDRIADAEQIRKFPPYWPQIGRPGDLIFIADQSWLSRYNPAWGGARFSEALEVFVKESRPNIRAFTLSAKGLELLQSFPTYMSQSDTSRFSAIRWSEHIKFADLPL